MHLKERHIPVSQHRGRLNGDAPSAQLTRRTLTTGELLAADAAGDAGASDLAPRDSPDGEPLTSPARTGARAGVTPSSGIPATDRQPSHPQSRALEDHDAAISQVLCQQIEVREKKLELPSRTPFASMAKEDHGWSHFSS